MKNLAIVPILLTSTVAHAQWLYDEVVDALTEQTTATALTFGNNGGALGVICTAGDPATVIFEAPAGAQFGIDESSLRYRLDTGVFLELAGQAIPAIPSALLATQESSDEAPFDALLAGLRSASSIGIEYPGADDGTVDDSFSLRGSSAPIDRVLQRCVRERSRSEIASVFAANKGAMDALYNRALRMDPALQGTVVLQVTITPAGSVSGSEIVSTELGNPMLEQQLVQNVNLLRFDAKDVETTTTTESFDFFPPGREGSSAGAEAAAAAGERDPPHSEEIRMEAGQAAARVAANWEGARSRQQAVLQRQHRAERAADAERARQQTVLEQALDAIAPIEQRIVLAGDAPTKGGESEAVLDRVLNEINQAAWLDYADSVAELQAFVRSQPQLTIPELTRGEFEKSEDFEHRMTLALAEANADYQNALAAWREAASDAQAEVERLTSDSESALLSSLRPGITERLGATVIAGATYDADAERFVVEISASGLDGFRISATLPVSIDVAPEVKQELLDGEAWVVFDFGRFSLRPLGVLLRAAESRELYRGSVESFSGASFVFDRNTLSAFEATLAEEEATRAAEAERQRAERERRMALEQERRRQERATWPEGAIGTMASGSFVCTSHLSATKARILELANNPFVSLPADCIILPERRFVVEARAVPGELTIVRFYGATARVYANQGAVRY